MESTTPPQPRNVPATGHGPPLPSRVLEKTAEHRLLRENRVLEALEQAGPGEIPVSRISTAAYADSPGVISFLAEHQTESHLFRLEAAGRVRRGAGTGRTWQLCRAEAE